METQELVRMLYQRGNALRAAIQDTAKHLREVAQQLEALDRQAAELDKQFGLMTQSTPKDEVLAALKKLPEYANKSDEEIKSSLQLAMKE